MAEESTKSVLEVRNGIIRRRQSQITKRLPKYSEISKKFCPTATSTPTKNTEKGRPSRKGRSSNIRRATSYQNGNLPRACSTFIEPVVNISKSPIEEKKNFDFIPIASSTFNLRLYEETKYSERPKNTHGNRLRRKLSFKKSQLIIEQLQKPEQRTDPDGCSVHAQYKEEYVQTDLKVTRPRSKAGYINGRRLNAVSKPKEKPSLCTDDLCCLDFYRPRVVNGMNFKSKNKVISKLQKVGRSMKKTVSHKLFNFSKA